MPELYIHGSLILWRATATPVEIKCPLFTVTVWVQSHEWQLQPCWTVPSQGPCPDGTISRAPKRVKTVHTRLPSTRGLIKHSQHSPLSHTLCLEWPQQLCCFAITAIEPESTEDDENCSEGTDPLKVSLQGMPLPTHTCSMYRSTQTRARKVTQEGCTRTHSHHCHDCTCVSTPAPSHQSKHSQTHNQILAIIVHYAALVEVVQAVDSGLLWMKAGVGQHIAALAQTDLCHCYQNHSVQLKLCCGAASKGRTNPRGQWHNQKRVQTELQPPTHPNAWHGQNSNNLLLLGEERKLQELKHYVIDGNRTKTGAFSSL